MKYLLLILIWPFNQCGKPKTEESFPRVVKNLCGNFAVQTLSWQRGYQHPDTYEFKYVLDTAFLGIRSGGMQGSSGGGGIIAVYSGGFRIIPAPDTTSVDYLKQVHKAMVWADYMDTIFDATRGNELIFKTEAEAKRAMNSYLSRKNEVQRFDDSVMKCHIYP